MSNKAQAKKPIKHPHRRSLKVGYESRPANQPVVNIVIIPAIQKQIKPNNENSILPGDLIIKLDMPKASANKFNRKLSPTPTIAPEKIADQVI